MRRFAIGLLGLLAFAGAAQAQTFAITRAEWSTSEGGRLRVEGTGTDGRTVTIRNAGNDVVLGTDTVEDGDWRRRITGLTQVPCTVSATQSGSTTVVTRNVSNRPANCGPVVGAARPTLNIANVSQNEGNSGTSTMTFTVTLSAAAPTGGVTFNFATANGTATAGSDYVATTGTRTIAAGQTTATIPVTINGDTAVEPNETFTVNITAATNTANATASATGTIVNDDQAVVLPTLSIGNVSQNEGNAGTTTMTFTATLSAAAPAGGVTFNFATANGTATAGSDYVATTGTRTIAAGQTTATIPVTINGDTTVEPDETFTVNITGATNTANATASATGTIVNDDQAAPLPTLSINNLTVGESVGTAVLTVSISSAPTTAVTVNFATANGTALAGSDYTATSGTLTFPTGTNASRTISVPIINDTVNEPTETFTVVLSNASNATIFAGTGTVTINDDDAAVRPTLSVNSPSQNEGNAGTSVMNFAVSLSQNAPTGGVSFSFATANGTATGGASCTAGTDYVTTSGTRTIAAGANSATIPVTICGDTTVEPNETIALNITAITNAANTTASGTGTIVNDDQAAIPNVSINSTSQSCGGAGQPACSNNPVSTPGIAGNTTFRVLAVNDLGMHCGDLDTRISSILPPFNVLRAVVIQQPATGQSPTRNPAGVTVSYSAASNAADPALSTQPVRVPATGGVYKTNFWAIGRTAYDPFYPGTTTGLNPFATPFNLTLPVDLGLPMPDTELFYLNANGTLKPTPGPLEFNQQAMPSFGSAANVAAGTTGPLVANGTPYVTNAPQTFKLLVTTQPFFTSFPFGYTANVNWWTAEGTPITPFDDFGRENPYPLMRVQASNATGVVATTDTVIPVSGEASCQSCHAAASDAQSVNVQQPSNGTFGIATAALANVRLAIDDPQLGQVPLAASVEWASDKNILKLHDLRNPTAPRLISGTTEDFPTPGATPFKAVVCQTCHYTPALDLAQLGPQEGATGTLGNGRQQGNNQTMSRVMHNHHGLLGSNPAQPISATNPALFPALPAPTQDANGVITNQTARQGVVDTTCYMCHPGKTTKCLRGAMSNGGMLCQDCHGNMSDVGNDFSRNLPSNPAGQFILAGDFYTNANTPRVPWANEPSCGSCHTGDAVNNLFTTNGTVNATTRATVVVNTRDVYNANDNIRLLQAFRSADANKKPIVPTNKRFAENVITPGATTAPGANPKLYRVSVDNHGAANGGGSGIFCEACHGATHAEWPNANANANDNVAANQLQGHTGVIAECSTCHGTSLNSYNGLDGPHGLHVIGGNASTSPPFASSNLHRVQGANYANCAPCHGGTSRSTSTGTPLSRTLADRRLNGATVAKGTPVACTRCH